MWSTETLSNAHSFAADLALQNRASKCVGNRGNPASDAKQKAVIENEPIEPSARPDTGHPEASAAFSITKPRFVPVFLATGLISGTSANPRFSANIESSPNVSL